MPRSSPSTSPPGAEAPSVEVVELDRGPGPGPSTPHFDDRKSRWAIAAGIALVVFVGLSLLPGSEVETEDNELGLGDPAVATTLVGNRARQVGTFSADTFPLWVVSGLKGFASLTEPVAFADRFWIVGNSSQPTGAAVILSSDDGRLWNAISELVPAAGNAIRIDQLGVVDGALVMAGTEGSPVGPGFQWEIAGNVQLWRSDDGMRWIPEVVHQSEQHIAFQEIGLAVSGSTTVVQATTQSTAVVLAAEKLPENLIPPLEEGLFTFTPHGFRAIVAGPLRIELAVVPVTIVMQAGTVRLFRSVSLSDWEEIDIAVDVSKVVNSPQGGFIANAGGSAFTSAYGVTWSRNAAYDSASYQRFGDDLIGFSHDGRGLEIVSEGGTRTVQLPADLQRCSIEASNGLLAAACPPIPLTNAQVVEWKDQWLSLNAFGGLELVDQANTVIRRFPVVGAHGIYDPETGTISLRDTEGVGEAFPIELLNQIRPKPTSFRYEVMLSRDGLTWAPGQTALVSYEMEMLGSIDAGFLFATRPYAPSSTLTVLAADF